MSIHPINAYSMGGRETLTHERLSRITTRLIIAIFFCGIFEGAARKWLLPSSIPELSYVAYLSKFIAFWLVCMMASVASSSSRILSDFRVCLQLGLILLACGVLLSAFSGFSVAGAFLTMVMIVASPLLAYFAASKVRTANIRQILQWIAVISIFPALLGLIQFELPATHVLNKYLGDTNWADVVTDLGRVRATGTFSFISGMSAMTVVCVWAGLSLRTLSARAHDQILGLVAVVSGFICGFVALSRSAIFMGLALLVIRLLFVGRDRLLLAIVIIGGLGYGYLSFDLHELKKAEVTVTSGVFVRHSQSDSVLDRLGGWGSQLLDASRDVPFGNGFGANQVGGKAVDTGRRVLVTYEAELARLVAEVGVLGLLGVLVIRIGLLLALFQAWQRMATSPNRDALLLAMVTVSMFFVTNTAFNHVAAGFVWPIVAIALAWASNAEHVGKPR